MATKQFKKWWKKQKATQYESPSCEDAWKAALEWVLNNYPDDAIYKIIKEELGDGNK